MSASAVWMIPQESGGYRQKLSLDFKCMAEKPEETKYLDAAKDIWGYIKEYVIDKREGSEWFWCVNADGSPIHEPIVKPWKCPYHNGRMCMEVIGRLKDAE